MQQNSKAAKLALKGAVQRARARIFPLGDVDIGTLNKPAVRDWWGDAQIVEKPFVFLQ